MFSKRFTWFNMIISTINCVVWCVWSYFNYAIIYSLIILPLSVVSILLTALFLHTDKLCCWCDPREQLSVYDPDLDKRFIMVDGEVVEDTEADADTPEVDVETGTAEERLNLQGDVTEAPYYVNL